MKDDDRDDPFDEFFEEIERMMNQMMGGNAEFRFEPGGNPGPTAESHDVHLDVHETDEQIRVVADIPGVEKDDIELTCDGETLRLQAAGGDREYNERIPLPGPVDEHSASATYNNGVLEVTLERREDDSTTIDL